MADDNNNDDNNNDDGNGDGTPKPNSGKVLREKLETTLTENAELKGKLLIHEAGLSHLTEKQRNAAIRDATEDGAELTADTLKKSATDLGFPASPVKQKDGNDDGNNGDGKGNEDEGGNEPEPQNSLEAIEQAQRRMQPVGADGDFETKLKNADSREAVEALIRSEGHKHGVVHEWDVE